MWHPGIRELCPYIWPDYSVPQKLAVLLIWKCRTGSIHGEDSSFIAEDVKLFLCINGKRMPLRTVWRHPYEICQGRDGRDYSVQIRDTSITKDVRPSLWAEPKKVIYPSFLEASHCHGRKTFPFWVSLPGLWIKALLSRDIHLECI